MHSMAASEYVFGRPGLSADCPCSHVASACTLIHICNRPRWIRALLYWDQSRARLWFVLFVTIQAYSSRALGYSFVQQRRFDTQKFHVLRLERLTMLGVTGVNLHGKFPDVIVYDKQRDWLVLIEAVTSVTPINPERREQLLALFQSCREKLVFVTAFLQRNGAAARTFITEIAWETEVWFADHPTHLLHFNGERFLGPYA